MATTNTLDESELTPGSDRVAALTKDSETANVTARRPDGLISKEDATRLSKKSDWMGLTYLVSHFGLIGVGAWLCWITFPGFAFIPVFLLHAFIIGFLFSPLHECAHSTAFKTRWLNETALWLVAVVYIVPPYYFRYFHLGHHRFTQMPGKDPSLVLPEPANFRQYLWYCAGLWFWWRNITWIAKHTFGIVHPSSADYVPKQRRGLMVLEARIMSMIYLFIALNALAGGFVTILLVCWILPRLVGEPIQRMIRVAEHVGCAETPDLLDNTRTTLTNSVVNALAWQMPYHAEHHLFPSVPFYKLPALHKRVGEKVIVERDGYIKGQLKIISMLLRNNNNDKMSSNAPML